jgi:quinol monooxygenase YgiN
MIVISGRARLLESQVEVAMRAASAMAVTSRGEPGCLDYRFATDVEDGFVMQVFEQWESSDALDAHFAAPHFAAFAEVLLQAVDGPAEFTRYEVSSAAPLFG